MFHFSKRSKELLYTCDDRLIILFEHVIRGVDCKVISGRRGEIEQNFLYDSDKSLVKYPNSKHNTSPKSMAVDVAPYPIDWLDTDRFYAFGGYVLGVAAALDIKIRWGGDWNGNFLMSDQTFDDLAHFELVLWGDDKLHSTRVYWAMTNGEDPPEAPKDNSAKENA